MELGKGLRTDERWSDALQGSWINAKNILISKGFKTVSNEYGFSKDNTIIGHNNGVIPLNIGRIEFTITDDNDFVISKIVNGVAEVKIRSKKFNWSKDYPIEGVFRYTFNNQLIIAFTDNYNTPKIINLDCIPLTLDNDKRVVNEKDFTLLNLFPEFNQPNYKLLSVTDSGGNLLSGTYYLTGSYVLADGSETNYFHISNQIIVNDDSKSVDFSKYDGIQGGKSTSKSINCLLTDLDLRFSKVKIVAIHKINGVKTAHLVGTFDYTTNNITVSYTGLEVNTDIPLQEILIPTSTYRTVKTMTTFKDELVIGNVTKLKDIDFQKYANNIKIRWCQGVEVSTNNILTSYKDEVYVFDKKGFKAGEVYCFFIDFSLIDGGYSKAYLISGREAENSDLEIINNPNFNKINNTIKKFQAQSTAKQDGTMGFWQNENEFYPDDDCYDIYDTFGFTGRTLRNKNIRHHRFPELNQLVTWGEPFVQLSANTNDNLVSLQNYSVKKIPPFYDNLYTCYFDSINYNSNFITLVENPNPDFGSYTITAKQDLVIKLELDLHITYNFGSGNNSYGTFPFVKITKRDNLGNKNDIYYKEQLGYNTITLDAVDTFQIELKEFESITIEQNHLIQFVPTASGSINILNINSLNLINNAYVKPLGIKVSDIIIPDEIKEQVTGFRILYAKRTPNNSLIIGQSLLFDKNWETKYDISNEARFHSFDMLLNKYDATPDYLKAELLLSGSSDDYSLYSNAVTNYSPVVDLIRKINVGKYIPNDLPMPNSIGFDNSRREECFYLKLDDTIPISLFTVTNPRLLCNLISYKVDCYKNFDEQILISTGKIHKITEDKTDAVYGGDTFINSYSLRLTAKNGQSGSTVDKIILSSFICESNSNIGLRHEGTEIYQKYPPKTDDFINYMHGLTYPAGLDEYKVSNYYAYNSDYSSLNDLTKNTPFKCDGNKCKTDEIEFFERVHKSIVNGKEDYRLQWRTFLSTDYIELPKGKGHLWKLVSFNKTLIMHMEYTLYVDTIKDKLSTNVTEVYLGKSNIFERELDEAVSTVEGYAGCQSQWAAFVCPLGYVFPDRQQGKWFIFNGKLNEISNTGNRNWFEKNCQTVNKDIDNPFIGKGLFGTFDISNNRLIFGKKDIVDSWTLSYSPDIEAMVCFHDYSPNYAFYNRDGHYFINNEQNLKGTYRGNNVVKKGIYFDSNIIFNSTIDLPHILEREGILENINWDSEIIDKDNNNIYNKTITQVIVYNYNQCSGIIELKYIDKLLTQPNIRNMIYTWELNQFRDLLISRDISIFDKWYNLIDANINQNKSWFNKSKFMAKFFITRLIYDNKEQNDIFIKDCNIKVRPFNR